MSATALSFENSQAYKSDFALMGLPSEHGRNAFHMAAPRAMDAAEAKRLYNRVKKQEQYARETALRVNPETHACKGSDPAKLARLVGKRNEARSQ